MPYEILNLDIFNKSYKLQQDGFNSRNLVYLKSNKNTDS